MVNDTIELIGADESLLGRFVPKKQVRFRTVSKFLWKPMRIAGEERWLCRASWREEYRPSSTHGSAQGEWEAVHWME